MEKEEVFVWGEPFRLGEVLDSRQGYDNPYGAFGTCGKTAVANVCTMAGLHVTEPEVLKYAMENDLCDTFDPKLHGGATTIGNQIALLEHYGLDAHCEFAAETASPERLAAALEGGYGIVAALNSGLLQHHDWKVYNDAGHIVANHAVCLTSTVRDLDHQLKGFYLCDSSNQTPEAGHVFVPIDLFNECYTKVWDACAVITDNPIR